MINMDQDSRLKYPAVLGSMTIFPAVIVIEIIMAPTVTANEHRETRGKRGRENRKRIKETGKSVMTASQTIENLGHIVSSVCDSQGPYISEIMVAFIPVLM